MGGAKLLAAAGAIALGLFATQPAQAALITVNTSTLLGTTPYTVSLGGGVGSLSFTAADTGGNGPGTAVATGGNAQVSTFTIFGTSTLSDLESGATVDGTGLNGFTFASYPTATLIPFSAADDYIGFAYTGTDGVHYGFAEVAGSALIGYQYNTTAGAAVVTTAVPEPASAALVLAGIAGLGVLRRRKAGTPTADLAAA